MRFIEVQGSKGAVEIIQVSHIVKWMDLGNGFTRINLSDSSFVVTELGVDTIWEMIEDET